MIVELFLIAHLLSSQPPLEASPIVPMASHTISLSNRYEVASVNEVFKDNILLVLRYLDGSVKSKTDVNWENINSEYHYELSLKPGEEFAFHEHVLPDYSKNIVKTTNSNFNWTDGYKSDGYLVGDGVCHLASLIYWTARDAGLDSYAPSNHNFAQIPDVPREYGVAILSPEPLGNLYITNNKENMVTFVFDYKNNNLTVSVLEGK